MGNIVMAAKDELLARPELKGKKKSA